MITFRSLTRDVEIGANAYLLEFEGSRVLVDAGMHPKREGSEALPNLAGIEFGSIDAALLSHAHLDHSGALPLVQREHPEMPVYTTGPTKALAEALLHNSVNVMGAKREELGLDEYPLFSHREVGRSVRNWHTPKTRRPFELDGIGVDCTLFDAGHILGAAGAKFEYKGRNVFYTGDVHFEDQTIVRGADFPERDIDALVIESTRGDSERDPEYTRWAEGERMAAAIERCLDRGGSVMLPVFAMGKTQETLTLLYELQRARLLRDTPFQISGLSVKMTTIYDRFADRVRRNHRGFHLLRARGFLSTPGKRGEIPELRQGHVYAMSSGMMTERTMSNRMARRFISNPSNLLIAVGYADAASPLARILDSERGEEVDLDPRHEPVKRECEIERFDFSGHAPREHLVDYVVRVAPEMVILVHGDAPAIQRVQQEIATRAPDVTVKVAEPDCEIEVG